MSGIFNMNNLKQLYKNNVNKDNSMLLAVMFSIAAVYIIFYMVSSLFKLPLIIITGTILGLYIHKKYKLSENLRQKKLRK
tara:strand:+ start:1164 stop:1403 length:240 start_codon:yes stop_codon:yes gene_type:complete